MTTIGIEAPGEVCGEASIKRLVVGEIGSNGEVVVDGICETTEDARAIDMFLITVLVVITNGGLQRWRNEIADIQAIGVQCTALVNAIELLFHITNRDQPIAVERPAIGHRFCIKCDLLEPDGFLVGDIEVSIT